MKGRAGQERRRDTATALAAAVAHGAILLLAVRFGGEPRPSPSPLAEDLGAVIEVETLVAPMKPAPAPAPIPAPGRDDGARAGNASSPRKEALPELPPVAASERAAPVASAAPVATGDAYGAAPAVPMPGDPLGLGVARWPGAGVIPEGPDVPGAPGTARSTGPLAPRIPAAGAGKTALRDAVRSRDRELGLGDPGATAIKNEVAAAVRASGVPNETSAVLVARIGGDGTLLSLTVQRFGSGDAAAWNAVVAAARAALGKRKLGLAGLGPGGAVVHIDVRSAMTYPSGNEDRVTPTLPSLTDGPPRDVAPAPSPDGDACAPERWSPDKPLCGVGMVIGRGDLTDLATRKHRAVHASSRVTLLDGAAPLPSPSATAPSASAPPAATATAVPSADAGAP